MGTFAQQSLPLQDYATLRIQRINHTNPETVIVRSALPLLGFLLITV